MIIVAMGVGSWSGATFHLVAYSFFQLLLFMAAGAVIRAARGETDMERLGGLVRRMPVTAVISGVALLSACGAGAVGIGLSGYYSRGLILRHAAAFAVLATGADLSRAYWAFFWIPIVATGLNSFAMTRWWMLIFGGRPRDRRLYNHAREAPTLLWPMAVLTIMTVLAGGWLGIGEVLDSSIVEARESVGRTADAVYPSRQPASRTLFSAVLPSQESGTSDGRAEPVVDIAMTNSPARDAALSRGAIIADRWLGIAFAIGIAIGAGIYLPGPWVAERIDGIPPVSWISAWLRNRMYFDEFYEAVFVTLAVGLAGLMTWVDRNVVQVLARLLLRV
jgi:NADH-quinone oxidoreductase subunit L